VKKIILLIRRFCSSIGKEVLTFSLLSILSLTTLICFVDLTPKVDENFFFSSDDPQFKSEKRISELFERKDSQIIISASGDIKSANYDIDISSLTGSLLDIDGVASVKSITNGPLNIREALISPFWSRLLIAGNKKSTNIILFLADSNSPKLINSIENTVTEHSKDNFKLRISGMPYIVELIQQNLMHDLKIFTFLTFFIFSLLMLLIFRSWTILSGTIITCLSACSWTLIATSLLKIPIGILTANLITIIFILTLSHIIFLTFNWRQIYTPEDTSHWVDKTIKITLPASFWSMVTTLLGFLSLLAVPAKPLRELGAAGTIGTIVSIIAAFGIYPAFLKLNKVSRTEISQIEKKEYAVFRYLFLRQKYIFALAIGIGLVLLPGLWMVNSDPSLLCYFKQKGDIANGLRYIDKNGGSSPLVTVIKLKSGEPLHSAKAYKKMWELQSVLKDHPSVSTIISLPVLMTEAKRSPLAFFIGWEWLLEIMEKPAHESIAKSFISPDRSHGLFLLRMREGGRTKSRIEITDQIKEIISEQGFVSELMGGVYILQGHLAKLVSSSLVFGLGKLLAVFFIIGFIVSRSLKVSCAMTVSILIVPLGIIGAIGLYRIPLDIISAPAANVAIAIGIDSMMHMINRYQRMKTFFTIEKERWYDVQEHLWQPILTSSLVVILGFGIFLFSQFPPTQRFGGSIVIGTMIAVLASLFIMPSLMQLRFKRRKHLTSGQAQPDLFTETATISVKNKRLS
jgi:uncharacterized protein